MGHPASSRPTRPVVGGRSRVRVAPFLTSYCGAAAPQAELGDQARLAAARVVAVWRAKTGAFALQSGLVTLDLVLVGSEGDKYVPVGHAVIDGQVDVRHRLRADLSAEF